MIKIGILGRGTMASGIAQVFAENNYSVTLFVRTMDPKNPKKSLQKIQKVLQRQVEKEKITQERLEEVLNKIEITTSQNNLSDCDLVIEAIFEKMQDKKDVFAKLDQICKPETILATNTSSLSITEIANATNRPAKVIGMHFFNPASVMMLIEVIIGMHTSVETKNEILNLSEKIGKTTVEINESPGFIVNRMLIPMINEAIGIVAEGIACPSDIDVAMKMGANHPMGPLELGDLIGLDVCLAIMDVLYSETHDTKYRAHTLLRKMVRGNQLGRKTKKGFYEY